MRLPFRIQRLSIRATQRAGMLSLALCLACDSNPFDQAEVPQITVTPVFALPIVRFSWTPQGAQLVRVYKGRVAGDGYGPDLMWSLAATGKNTIQSGIEYGTTVAPGAALDVSAQALVNGQAYTVQISRQDPKANGSDGFTNNANRYVATQMFIVGSTPPP